MKFNEEFSICKIADSAFLVPLGSQVMDMGKIIDLNEMSEFILNLMKEKEYTKKQLVELIYKDYDADKETIETDLDEFIDKGMEMGFILPS